MAQYRRSIFLINRPFQLRFSFYVCSWLFALSLAYPLIIYQLFEYFVRYMANDPTGPGVAVLQQTKQEMVWLLVLLQIIFLTVTFLISIFVSHKIAGPLYKLRKFFEQAERGEWSGKLFFRKRDHFPELAESYNEMMAAIRARVSAGVSDAAREVEAAAASASPDSRAKLEKALATLRELESSSRAPAAAPAQE